MSIPTPFEVIEFTAAEELVSLLADLAVSLLHPEVRDGLDIGAISAAVRERATRLEAEVDFEEYLESLSSASRRDARWQATLIGLFEQIPEHRLCTVLADNCIDSTFLEQPLLAEGVFLRRLDAVLDLAQVPFCGPDVQGAFGNLAVGLAESKLTWVHDASVFTSGFAGGAAAGAFFLPFLASLGMKGGEYLMTQGAQVDEASEQCARLLLAAMSTTLVLDDGHHDDEAHAHEQQVSPEIVNDLEELRIGIQQVAFGASKELDAQRSRGANTYFGDGGYFQRRAKVALAAATFVTGMVADVTGSPVTVTAPRVVGHPLGAAIELLETVGCVVEARDLQGRTIWNKANWRVATQDDVAGSKPGRVVLTVTRYGE